jgi:hypothetical protein
MGSLGAVSLDRDNPVLTVGPSFEAFDMELTLLLFFTKSLLVFSPCLRPPLPCLLAAEDEVLW